MMRLYFSGTPQPTIAKKAGVDQSTVSIYASRFKNRATEVGLRAAGKEVNVFDEVEGLRSLSAELSKVNLTVEDAKQGLGILTSFMKLGIAPENHTALIRVCEDIGDPRFVRAAVKLSQIEANVNMSYEEVISRFETVTSSLPSVQKSLTSAQTEIKSLNHSVAQKRRELTNLDARLAQLDNEARIREARLKQDLDAKMKQLNVREKEIEEVWNFKTYLRRLGLEIPTLAKLAKEFDYDRHQTSGAKLEQALERFGSLQNAVEKLEQLKREYEKHIEFVKEQAAQLGKVKAQLLAETKALREKLSRQTEQLQSQSRRIQARELQYYLFEGFIAMVEGSPSVTKSIEDLVAMFQWLLDSGWQKVLEPHQLRSIFVNNVMGQFLNSFRCSNCDTVLIMNRGAPSKYFVGPLSCPACCHRGAVRSDDSFLRALVSADS